MTLEDYITSIHKMRIAVLGIGISNLPLIELLCRHHCDVTACDRRSFEQLGETGNHLLSLGVKLRLGENYLEDLDEELIFRTPGLMPYEHHLEAARKNGSIITSEMEVFFSLCPSHIFAVTGSDGKTTTTTLISELLKIAGYRVHLGGNIGKPLLCDLPEIQKDDMVVLELSSFQLHSMSCRPHVAVMTNLSPNHLDKHKSFQDYIDAKANIFAGQCSEDRLILNYDDPHTPYYQSKAQSRISYFSDKRIPPAGAFCSDGVICLASTQGCIPIMKSDEIRIPGQHNIQNMLAAFEAVRDYVSPELCRKVAMQFPGVPHRLEEVRKIHEVTYINDSIASSPTRTIAGLRALKSKPIIILGGYDKHIPFDGLGKELVEKAKAAILTGDTASKIEEAIDNAQSAAETTLETIHARDIPSAVELAYEMAVPGDIVILSPACASFDHFKNFEERGNLFKQVVNSLKE